MSIIKKWRELNINPEEINFKNIKLLKIISYPHCGNDVVECDVIHNNEKKRVFIKIERSSYSAFQTETNHLQILHKDKLYSKIPILIEDGTISDKKYIVLGKVLGKRLSEILLKIDDEKIKKNYLVKYGEELGKIHLINPKVFDIAKQRTINDYPSVEKQKSFDETINPYINYLVENKPEINFDTFIHGDFHYGNILWKNKNINGVLDWEYSGKGFKEQDIAWACILRSTQHFMDNINDINNFLLGYKNVNKYDVHNLKWCLINGYCHFYLMNKDNEDYRKKIVKLMSEIMNDKLS